MASSLFTGVSGLRTNQQMLDVVGNNLANSNTTGFKSQRVQFSDLFYQTYVQASQPGTGGNGGTNPVQVGLGAQVASIDANLQQGSVEATGRDLDLAIEGNGFFVARNGAENIFTRSGAFGVDSANYLVDPSTGYRVQRFGTTGEGTATSPAFQVAGNNDISIPFGAGIPAAATTTIDLQGNLSAQAAGPLAQVLTSVQGFQSGNAPATAATLLNALDDNLAAYVVGDQVTLQGIDAANATVNVSVGAGPATTLGDLLTAINANFAGVTASLDANGNLVVQANATGPSNLNLSLSDAAGNTGGTSWAFHDPAVTTAGKDGDVVRTGIQVFDSQGSPHTLDLVFQKQANNQWDLTGAINPSDGVILDDLVSQINFGQDGSFSQVAGTGLGNGTITVQWGGFAAPQTIGFSFGSVNGFDGLTQVGGGSSAVATGQDGYPAGFLTSLNIGHDGVINGILTNGQILPIAQLAVAAFANAGALNRIGDNYFAISSESGPALLGGGLSGGRGAIQQRALESSNVDAALEFTRLIIAQRGFQMNARVITVSNEVLQELANILR